ncbi:MAG: hypothetical protein U9R08_00720 [Nanoarchaeota archaeon]|nr:hypothetical protein [Nanoarchaeota archaeon]
MRGSNIVSSKISYADILADHKKLKELINPISDRYNFLQSTVQEYRLLDCPTDYEVSADGTASIKVIDGRISQKVQPSTSAIMTPSEYFSQITQKFNLDNLLKMQVLKHVLKGNSPTTISLSDRTTKGKPDLDRAYTLAKNLVTNWIIYNKRIYSHELSVDVVHQFPIAEAAGLEESYEMKEAKVRHHVFESDKFIEKLLQTSEDTSLEMVLRTSARFIFG